MEQLMYLLPVGGFFAILAAMLFLGDSYSLNRIKSKQVGDGQYGTARFAAEKEIRDTFLAIPYEVRAWRSGQNLPKAQDLQKGAQVLLYYDIVALSYPAKGDRCRQ